MSSAQNVYYRQHGEIDTPPYYKKSSKEHNSTALKVGAIAIGVILGGVVALLVAHFGFGFPLNSLNTIGSTIGGAVLGGIVGYICKTLHQYFKKQECSCIEDETNSDDDSTRGIEEYVRNVDFPGDDEGVDGNQETYGAGYYSSEEEYHSY